MPSDIGYNCMGSITEAAEGEKFSVKIPDAGTKKLVVDSG